LISVPQLHFRRYLHMAAWPRILAPNDQIGSSQSCRISFRATRATIAFFSLTASVLMAAKTSASVLSVRLQQADLVRSLRRLSSQHSNSCTIMSLSEIFGSSHIVLPSDVEIGPCFTSSTSGDSWALKLFDTCRGWRWIWGTCGHLTHEPVAMLCQARQKSQQCESRSQGMGNRLQPFWKSSRALDECRSWEARWMQWQRSNAEKQ